MMRERKEIGFPAFIAEMAAPFDHETLERWIGEVRPMVAAPDPIPSLPSLFRPMGPDRAVWHNGARAIRSS
jgi:hypothetical protein